MINKALHRAVIKRRGLEIFPVYYGCDPQLLSKKKRRKIELKETSGRLILHLHVLVVFTRKLEMLVTILFAYFILFNVKFMAGI